MADVKDNLIIISTYIASGVTESTIIDERISLLEYLTIPSLKNQTDTNFVWFIYLDKLNNPNDRFEKLKSCITKNAGNIKFFIFEYEPILHDGSLCVQNRGRSCSIKRGELYNLSVGHIDKLGLLKNIKTLAHVMLDDDDPVLPKYISDMNNNVQKYKNVLEKHYGLIVVNLNQFVLYLNDLNLCKIESNKALKGPSYVIYDIKNMYNYRFHPYSILEDYGRNEVYLKKYDISLQIVKDEPTWVYLRHNCATSNYSKQFIINKGLDRIVGSNNIAKILNINPFNLNKIFQSFKNRKKDKSLIKWVNTRNDADRNNKILFIIHDTKYLNIIHKLQKFLKNNYDITFVNNSNIPNTNLYLKIFYFHNANVPKNNKFLYIKDDEHIHKLFLNYNLPNIKTWDNSAFITLYKFLNEL